MENKDKILEADLLAALNNYASLYGPGEDIDYAWIGKIIQGTLVKFVIAKASMNVVSNNQMIIDKKVLENAKQIDE